MACTSEPRPAPSAPSDVLPRLGEVIGGKYRMEQVLGAGGMGVVAAARHLILDQQVAIKLMLPAAAERPGGGARFLREARAAATLRSEHVARVLDVGTLDSGAPYIVLEYLNGCDFGTLLKQRGPLGVAEAVDFVLQVGEAIAEAHARGIVHRDLKPRNLFLTSGADGAPLVKVLDFGLSRVVDPVAEEESLTKGDILIGSIHYMSPEQICSQKNADARTDIWALGVILYEALAGRRPFDGDGTAGTCARVLIDAPAPLSSARPDLPEGLVALIERCLEKDPARRIQRVTDLAQGLAPFGTSKALLSLDTIVRLLPEEAADSCPPSTQRPPPSLGPHAIVPYARLSTMPPPSQRHPPPARRRLLPALMIALAMLGAVLVGWIVYLRAAAASGFQEGAAAGSTSHR